MSSEGEENLPPHRMHGVPSSSPPCDEGVDLFLRERVEHVLATAQRADPSRRKRRVAAVLGAVALIALVVCLSCRVFGWLHR